MVKKTKGFWQCEECKILFREEPLNEGGRGHLPARIWAEKCEAWCRKSHTCHIGIMKHAVSGPGKSL